MITEEEYENNLTHDRVTDALSYLAQLHMVPAPMLEHAANRGKKIHAFIEAKIKGFPLLGVEEEHEGYLNSFDSWYEGKQFVASERRFKCDDLLIRGTCDGIYIDDGKLVLVDFKTPLRESKTWCHQLAAYKYLAEKYGYKIQRIEAVKLNKKGGSPDVYVYEDDLEIFRKVLEIYRKFIKGTNKKALIEDY